MCLNSHENIIAKIESAHQRQMFESPEYHKGYQFARYNAYYQNLCTPRLKDALQVFASIALGGDNYTAGMAHAVHEMLWSRQEVAV